ncbi:sulfatase-like hydrolase/transferase [Dactylosporangium roseum]|uniref:Sulfatase-like hydrolase/transferase n=1 Tax=Dactylosporangium roseum TaxID=47989 RepID=A0ABY5Z0I9_9ACTN|nr:sulfatase [Dactylosporangium roseum]UWZ34293.1 sulfatase-like hydrolase/transferase [Dactylosporangium roseum]
MTAAPNLLFVIADQWRAGALGFLGEDPVLTPALDELASRSRVLTDAVSTYPVCSPCRAMLMSGQYPHRNGVPFNVNSATAPDVGLRPETRCWSDVLSDAGFALGYIGKWHLEAPVDDDAVYGEGRRDDGKVWDAYTPPEHRHGFDFWYSHGCCDNHAQPHFWVGDAPREEVLRVDQWSAEHETDVAVDYLRTAARHYRERAQRFALVLSYNPPHQPFDHVPDRYRGRYEGRDPRDLLRRPNVDWGTPAAAEAADAAPLYYAAITGVDEQIGRLLAVLDDEGLTGDTIVVFTSDHGMQLGSHGLVYKNVPYEESMRVPFLVSWPGHIEPGHDDLLLGSPDVAATLLGLLGQAGNRPPAMQGRDLSGQLLTAGGPETAGRPEAALYIGPGRENLRLDVRGLRTRTHKLIVEAPPGEPLRHRLFDLVADPYERTDVAGDQPDVVASTAELLCRELDRTGDPWPGRRKVEQELVARSHR